MKRYTDKQFAAIDKAARQHINEQASFNAIVHYVKAFEYDYETWNDMREAFFAGVNWAVRHYRLLGLKKNKMI